MARRSDGVLKKKDLIKIVANETGYMVSDVKEVVEALFNTIEQSVIDGKDCNLGAYYFGSKITESKTVKDPRTQIYFEKKNYSTPFIKLLPGFKRKFKQAKREKELRGHED